MGAYELRMLDAWHWEESIPMEVLNVLLAVIDLIGDYGYEGLADALMTRRGVEPLIEGGKQIPVNVIPGGDDLPLCCCRNLVAISSGSRGKGGLTQVLRSVRSHLIHCAGGSTGMSTKNVLVFFDTMNTRTFWESKRDFLSQASRNGVEFFFFKWNGRSIERVKLM
jgi:hypothetical protein